MKNDVDKTVDEKQARKELQRLFDENKLPWPITDCNGMVKWLAEFCKTIRWQSESLKAFRDKFGVESNCQALDAIDALLASAPKETTMNDAQIKHRVVAPEAPCQEHCFVANKDGSAKEERK